MSQTTISYEPLLDRSINRILLHFGIIGLLISSMILAFQWIIAPEYASVLFNEGIMESMPFNRILGVLHSQDFAVSVLICLGFFGVFSKHGQKVGYLFVFLYLFPIFSLQEIIAGPLIQTLSVDPVIANQLGAYLPYIASTIILALMLMKNRVSSSRKRILVLASLMLVLVSSTNFIWFFFSSSLRPRYDFINMTVEGNPVNALLAGVPDLIVTSVSFLVYAILFAVELKGLSETKSGQRQGLGKSHELPSLSQYRR